MSSRIGSRRMGTEEGLKQSLRSAYKFRCEICHRKFQKPSALKSHENTVHSKTLSRKLAKSATQKPKTAIQKVGKVARPGNVSKISEKNAPPLTAETPPTVVDKEEIKNDVSITDASEVREEPAPEVKEEPLPVIEELKETNVESDLRSNSESEVCVTKAKNTQFQCPKCMKVYPMFFPCRKHIEKEHCGPGGILSDQINPIRVESYHDVTQRLSDRQSCNYLCSDCKINFLTLQLFQNHVSQKHFDSMESMFFPTFNEFNTWKNRMEAQTQAQYATLSKRVENKDVYHCMKHVVLPRQYMKKCIERMCPSMISTQTFSKGIQVHYCKLHCGHTSKHYNLGKKYSKYSLPSLMTEKKESTDEVKDDQFQLYDRLQTLMDYIVMDAARLNAAGLKLLIGKALEMSNLLESYDRGANGNGQWNANKKLTDNQIMKELEPKIVLNKIESKKQFVATKRKGIVENLVDNKRRRLLQQTTLSSKNLLKKPNLLRRKEPKIVNIFSLANANSAFDELLKSNGTTDSELKPNQKSIETTKSESDTITELGTMSRSPISNVAMTKIDRTPVPCIKKRKQIVKPRIERFSSKNVNSVLSVKDEVKSVCESDKVKDVKYKVIEQENDCNILVLKL